MSIIHRPPNVIAGTLAHTPGADDPGRSDNAIPKRAKEVRRDSTSG